MLDMRCVIQVKRGGDVIKRSSVLGVDVGWKQAFQEAREIFYETLNERGVKSPEKVTVTFSNIADGVFNRQSDSAQRKEILESVEGNGQDND